MKIGILTQPLSTNYGGLLQAYALQIVLKRMGHEVWTIDQQLYKRNFILKFLSLTKRIVLNVIFRKSLIVRAWPTYKEKCIITQNTNNFIKNNINITDRINGTIKSSLLNKYQFEVYIVGSDQVWRPHYSPCLSNYFLDFLNGKNDIKRIAYAASFGVDYWEFSKKETSQYKKLIHKFNAISVREDSAIKLCRKYLDINPSHVLDPTMLLKKEDYIKLLENEYIPKSKGNLLIYILDKSTEKEQIIKNVTNELKMIPFTVMPKMKFAEVGKKLIDACIYPSVLEWICGFRDAEYVITDSFHGTVFSIIFNKQFITIGNPSRGLSRFTSLLEIFGLEDRLILSSTALNIEKINSSIDFSKINQILEKERVSSDLFLRRSLNN